MGHERMVARNGNVVGLAEEPERRDRHHGCWRVLNREWHVSALGRRDGVGMELLEALWKLLGLSEGKPQLMDVHFIFPAAVATVKAPAVLVDDPVRRGEATRNAHHHRAPAIGQRNPMRPHARQPRRDICLE